MDRFYPLGLPSAGDVWKTSYEVQNEMKSLDRSAYPPGTAVHQPGSRDMFGFSTPGPVASRLARPELALTQEVDLPNPRERQAIVHVQEPDDRRTFLRHDVPEMVNSRRSTVATMSLSPKVQQSMAKTRSLPALEQTPVPPRLAGPTQPISSLEDEHFDYFVAKGLQMENRDKLLSISLPRLRKADGISFPLTGEGTGFRAQNHSGGWTGLPCSHQDGDQGATVHRASFRRPPFYRLSPVQQAAAFRDALR